MKRIVAMILAAVLAFGAWTALAEKAGEGITIGVVVKQSDNPYFTAGAYGFEQASKTLGFRFWHEGPEDGSTEGQIRIIQRAMDEGVDALCVSANDPARLAEVCEKAREKGIRVISWDARVDASGRDLDVEPASAQVIGQTQLNAIVNAIGGQGQIAVVSTLKTAPNQNLWIASIEAALESGDKRYDGIEYVGTVYGDDDYQKSYAVTQTLLEKYPDLKGIIVPSVVGGPAVCQCVQDAGRAVKVTGLTLASDMKPYIEAGIVDETFMWNPIELGYASAYAAVAMVRGECTGAAGERIACGDLGELVINESDDGGTVLYLNKLNSFNEKTVDAWTDIF